MSKPRTWTDEMYDQVVYLHEKVGLGWKTISHEFDDTPANVLAAYRRAKGCKHSAYADQAGDGTRKSFTQTNKDLNVRCSVERAVTSEEVVKLFNVDTDIWELKEFTCKINEAYRKDREGHWKVEGGVATGEVHDSGKMLVVPLYNVSAKFIKKTEVAQAKVAITSMLEDTFKFSPKYPKINYRLKMDEGCLYEIDMFDTHFGRLTWGDESGLNYDIRIAKKVVTSAMDKLLAYSSLFPISRILFPVGNDFFNVDNKFNTTTGGTPQQEDTRWQKTFKAGRELLVELIDKFTAIAPVDVVVIPGNHDEQRSFYLGDSLYGWYHNCPNVTINNNPSHRKYYQHGVNMIGFAHGKDEKLGRLPLLMALEAPKMWADTTYREVHTGDKHHKEDLQFKSDESLGVVVRILRSLASYDAWTVNSGYQGALIAAEAFVWHPKDKLIAQFTATPDPESYAD